MAPLLLKIDPASVLMETGSPLQERVIAGAPVHRTWNIEDTGDGLYAGIWESTPGEWRVEYTEWEYFHVLSGISVLTEDGGDAVTLGAGDSFVIRPGFKGSWRVEETTRKHYVIRT